MIFTNRFCIFACVEKAWLLCCWHITEPKMLQLKSDAIPTSSDLPLFLYVIVQLVEYLNALEIPQSSCGEDTAPLRRCLTSGLFPHAARAQPDGSYSLIATGQGLNIHPSSVLSASSKMR